jgi:hypothetical protein
MTRKALRQGIAALAAQARQVAATSVNNHQIGNYRRRASSDA